MTLSAATDNAAASSYTLSFPAICRLRESNLATCDHRCSRYFIPDRIQFPVFYIFHPKYISFSDPSLIGYSKKNIESEKKNTIKGEMLTMSVIADCEIRLMQTAELKQC